MKYNIFPNETSKFKSEFELEEIKEILKENTFNGSLSSTAHTTEKMFIGSIEEDKFKIISSSNSTSMFCVFEGQFNKNENVKISITKKFNPVFRNLFIFWAIAMISILIILPGDQNNRFTQGLMLLIFIPMVRYLIITFIYRNSEEEGIEKLTNILKLTEVL